MFGPAKCTHCGQVIEKKTEKYRGRKFCSIRCRDLWKREDDRKLRT